MGDGRGRFSFELHWSGDRDPSIPGGGEGDAVRVGVHLRAEGRRARTKPFIA